VMLAPWHECEVAECPIFSPLLGRQLTSRGHHADIAQRPPLTHKRLISGCLALGKAMRRRYLIKLIGAAPVVNLARCRLKKSGNGIRPDRNEARIVIEIDLSRGFDPENTRIVEISLETSRQRRRQGSLGVNDNRRYPDELRGADRVKR
jgi:hypothetical protein